MGNWNINIEGVGCHHNDDEKDVDKLASEFVKKLKENGQNIEHATLFNSQKTDLIKE